MAKVVSTKAGETVYTLEFTQDEVNYLSTVFGFTWVAHEEPRVREMDTELSGLFNDLCTDNSHYFDGELTYRKATHED